MRMYTNLKYIVALGAVVLVAMTASAATIGPFSSNIAQFSSDTEADQTISIPAFDLGSGYQLDTVSIDVLHSASVDIVGDNDDPFKTASVNARMVRSFSVTGPDVAQSGGNTISSGIVNLSVDDGDLGVVDSNPADGTDFGGPLSYTDLLAGTANPAVAGYIGIGMIDFTVDVLSMINDQQFWGTAPDRWQLEVENPVLKVWVDVTYSYHAVPEPASLSLLAVGGLLTIRRRG